jgi:hypothetical protein
MAASASSRYRQGLSYRGNTISFQFSREHHCDTLPKRIGHGQIAMWDGRDCQRLRTMNDHHQGFVGADERNRWPRSHSGIDRATT